MGTSRNKWFTYLLGFGLTCFCLRMSMTTLLSKNYGDAVVYLGMFAFNLLAIGNYEKGNMRAAVLSCGRRDDQ